MQALTRPAISASVSGVSTTNGYSTRQSVASVTCETRDRPSNLMLSLRCQRRSLRSVRRRRSYVSLKETSKAGDGAAARLPAIRPPGVALRVGVRRAALLHLGQAVVQRVDQQLAPLGVVQQVVLQVGIALHDPDVAQHLVQHARGAAGAALVAQAVQQVPGARAEQADDDLAVGERGVVVGDLAQARRARRVAAKSCSSVVGAFIVKSQRLQPVPAAVALCYRSATAVRRPLGGSILSRSYGNPACRAAGLQIVLIPVTNSPVDCPV
jgi:hypothetical protein